MASPSFTHDSGSTPVEPRPAASVILLRERQPTGEVEVFLVRRHRGASFMSHSFVFPGGVADPGDNELRITAVRELFEEAGVLLCDGAISPQRLDYWRAALDAGEADLDKLPVRLDISALHYYSHWITPSVEKKRFSALFYVALLPAGQRPSIDHKEVVEERWVTPGEALEHASELHLPPPQLRTLWELDQVTPGGMDAVFESARKRAEQRQPLLPRLMRDTSPVTLLLPWDPDYESAGVGEAQPMPADYPFATGPSRFILEDTTWKHTAAPSSPSAE